jgi:hypothetical protein
MHFTKRDIRAFHLASEFAKDNLELQLIEYHKLIDRITHLGSKAKVGNI